jgi:hypothetical protein
MIHPRVRLLTFSPLIRDSWYWEYPFTLDFIIITDVVVVDDFTHKKMTGFVLVGLAKSKGGGVHCESKAVW